MGIRYIAPAAGQWRSIAPGHKILTCFNINLKNGALGCKTVTPILPSHQSTLGAVPFRKEKAGSTPGFGSL